MAETEQADTKEQTEAQNAEFTEAQDIEAVPGEENLDILLDVNMPITVNIGSSVVPFRRLLQLGPGSVLQLDKTIGQPAELFMQDIKFATGDIVVVDGCFAVRISEILGMEQPDQAEE
jgi:flagellar motor switch protein FliN/FliY